MFANTGTTFRYALSPGPYRMIANPLAPGGPVTVGTSR
jgi:hypothetical protein